MRKFWVALVIFIHVVIFAAVSQSPPPCVEHWELDCVAAKKVTEMLAVYNLTLKQNMDMAQLLKSTASRCTAQKDSLQLDYKKSLKKEKRKRKWTNFAAVGLIVLVVLK